MSRKGGGSRRAILRRVARVLLAGKNVAGVGEGRDPASVVEPGIPADVIHMEVRAEHDIYILWPAVRSAQTIQIGIVQAMRELKIRAVPCRCRCKCRSGSWSCRDGRRRTETCTENYAPRYRSKARATTHNAGECRAPIRVKHAGIELRSCFFDARDFKGADARSDPFAFADYRSMRR